MPLKSGKSNIGANIKELEESETPRSHKQILAIALSKAKVGEKLKSMKFGRKK